MHKEIYSDGFYEEAYADTGFPVPRALTILEPSSDIKRHIKRKTVVDYVKIFFSSNILLCFPF